MTAPAFVIEDLACRRGGRVLFQGVELELAPGGAALVVGRNGAGKSSLLRVVAGLIPPLAGRVLWRGVDTRRTPESYREAMRYVGHADGLQTALTVAENLAYWARLSGAPDDPDALDRALAAVGLAELAALPARLLSAGQRRRLALARPIASRADDGGVWLLDEPTVALDRPSIALIEAAIAEFRADGGIVLASTNAPLTLPGAVRLDVSEFQLATAG